MHLLHCSGIKLGLSPEWMNTDWVSSVWVVKVTSEAAQLLVKHTAIPEKERDCGTDSWIECLLKYELAWLFVLDNSHKESTQTLLNVTQRLDT
jgi:hypothetical protein